MNRVRTLVTSLARTRVWQCWVCKTYVDDHLTRCPVKHS